MRNRSDSLTIREKSKSNGDPQDTQREWPSPNAVKMLMVNAHLHQKTRNVYGCIWMFSQIVQISCAWQNLFLAVSLDHHHLGNEHCHSMSSMTGHIGACTPLALFVMTWSQKWDPQKILCPPSDQFWGHQLLRALPESN